MIAFLLLFASTGPAAAPLHVGDPLPTVSGETLSGKTLTVPQAATGKPAILVFSFSRAGGDDARAWNGRIDKEIPDRTQVPSFTLMMLESVPRMIRGMVISGIRKGMPPAQQERSAPVYRDEPAWKKRLSVADESHAYVVLIDRDSHICWMGSSAFSESAFGELKEALARIR